MVRFVFIRLTAFVLRKKSATKPRQRTSIKLKTVTLYGQATALEHGFLTFQRNWIDSSCLFNNRESLEVFLWSIRRDDARWGRAELS